jgi:hypothetical protein
VRLVREAVALTRVARDAGADHVFPGRQATFVARQDVIEIQLLALESFSAVLAGIVVAFKDVVPGEFHFLLWKDRSKSTMTRGARIFHDGGDHLGLASGAEMEKSSQHAKSCVAKLF